MAGMAIPPPWQPVWTIWRHRLSAFREELLSRGSLGDVPPFRFHDGTEMDWSCSPNGTDEGLLRFLQARKGDVKQAADMFIKQLHWRRHAFPILREGRVAEILDDSLPHQKQRFAKLGHTPQGLPVIKQDMMWGRLVTEKYSALDCVRAYILFLEENMVMAENFMDRQIVVVSYGGFCPADWGRTFATTLQDNYPERLVRAVVWPVPVFLCKTVRTFLYLFASKQLNAKIEIETDEDKLLQHTELTAAQLPDYMQGGLHAIIERDKPDVALIRKLVMDGFKTRGQNLELQSWPFGGQHGPKARSPQVQAVTRAGCLEVGAQKRRSTLARSQEAQFGGACFSGMLRHMSWCCGCVARDDDKTTAALVSLPRGRAASTLVQVEKAGYYWSAHPETTEDTSTTRMYRTFALLAMLAILLGGFAFDKERTMYVEWSLENLMQWVPFSAKQL